MRNRKLIYGIAIIVCILMIVVESLIIYSEYFSPGPNPDTQLQVLIRQHNVTPLHGIDQTMHSEAKIALGRLLFFDKILSGNKDISCATCHHPTLHSGDELAVSIGTGGSGLGKERQLGEGRAFIPRNAPEVFNRGETAWHSMFWDSRISRTDSGAIVTPAGDKLPSGVESVLAAQAMFPVLSRDEMRGHIGDLDIQGQPNELALLDDTDEPAIWAAIMARILAIPEYVTLLEAAYPDTPPEDLGFQHIGNAIAAFEGATFHSIYSPWNYYLKGDLNALSAEAKEGALLFFGDAGCGQCHTGSLLTDQAHHVLAVPQVGPGKGDTAPLDLGRILETDQEADRFAFRTPSLHNVALTGPYMHDGAFKTLESAISHHLNPAQSLNNYDSAQHLPPALRDTFQNDTDLLSSMLANLDTEVLPNRLLSNDEVELLLTFLASLTDSHQAYLEIVPETVPSGLPVSDDLTNLAYLPAQPAP